MPRRVVDPEVGDSSPLSHPNFPPSFRRDIEKGDTVAGAALSFLGLSRTAAAAEGSRRPTILLGKPGALVDPEDRVLLYIGSECGDCRALGRRGAATPTTKGTIDDQDGDYIAQE